MTPDNFCFYLQNSQSKPVKQEVNSTVILPPLVFPVQVYYASTVFGLNQGPRALYMIMILHQLSIYTSMKHSLLQTFENKRLRFNL
jgi:hypothetical protein